MKGEFFIIATKKNMNLDFDGFVFKKEI